MKNYKKIIALTATGLACTAITGEAALTQVNSGAGFVNTGTYTPSGTLTTVYTGSTYGYSMGGGVDTGTVQSIVLKDSNNPLGANGYVFEYIVNSTLGDISLLGLNGFNLSSVYVGTTSGATIAQASLNQATGVLNLVWNPNLTPALSGGTTTVFVETAATFYGYNAASVADNQPPGTVQTLAPVPEASTVMAGALMLLPLGVSTVRILRNRKSA